MAAFTCGQLFAAHQIELRQIFSDQRPQDRRGDVAVIVSQHVADTRDFLPRDVRMPGFQFFGRMATGFGNDFHPARSTSH